MKEIKIDLLPLINKLEAVLKRGFTRELMAGGYQSVFRGKGMEFVGYREYSPNDDALLIDWKASLKAHKMMVRLLEEERNLTVFFIMCVSDSMLFSSHLKLKCEYAAELVGTMSYAMHQVGDSVGMLMFSDRIVSVVPPGLGKNQFYKMVRSLSNPDLYGGGIDIRKAMNYVLSLRFLKNDSIVFIVSDFIHMPPGWEHDLKIMGLKYDLTCLVVRDPVDMRLPAVGGEVYLGDPYSGNRLLINPGEAKAEYEKQAQAQIQALKRELNKTGSSLLLLETNKEFTGEVFRFFRNRQQYKR